MNQNDLVTQKAKAVTIVVMVGGPKELIQATRNAAAASVGALTVACNVGEAATNVAQFRPFAIVMNDDVYGFDTQEFDALAKDVNAALITINMETTDLQALESELKSKISTSYQKHRTL